MYYSPVASITTIRPGLGNAKTNVVNSSGHRFVLYGFSTAIAIHRSTDADNEIFTSVTIDTGTPAHFGMAIDSADKICIVWAASGILHYCSTSDGVNFSTIREYNAGGGLLCTDVSIAIDTNDLVHVTYKLNSAPEAVCHQTVDDAAWDGAPTTIVSTATHVYTSTCLASYSTNKLVVAFENAVNAGSKEIWESHSGDGGANWSAAIQLHARTSLAQIHPFVDSGSDGTFTIVFSGYSKDGNAILVIRPIFTKSSDYGANWGVPNSIWTAPWSQTSSNSSQMLCENTNSIYIVSTRVVNFNSLENAGVLLSYWNGIEWTYTSPITSTTIYTNPFIANATYNNKLGIAFYTDASTDSIVHLIVSTLSAGTLTSPTLIETEASAFGKYGYNSVLIDSADTAYAMSFQPYVYDLYKSDGINYGIFERVSKLMGNTFSSIPYASVRSPNQDIMIILDPDISLWVYTCADNEPQIVPHSPNYSGNYHIPSSSGSNSLSWSPDGEYVAIADGTTPYIQWFRSDGTGLITRLVTNAPDVAAAGSGNSVAWSADSLYCALAHTTTPFLTFFKNNGDDTFTKLTVNAPDTIPVTNAFTTAWSPNGTYLAIGTSNSTNRLKFYKNNADDTFTLLTSNAPNSQPSATIEAFEWSPDNTYLAALSASAIQFYKNNGNDTFTKLTTNAPNTNYTGGTALRWSPSGDYLAVGLTGATTVIYSNNGDDTFTLQSAPTVLPVGNQYGVEWSADETYLYTSTYANNLSTKMNPYVYSHLAGQLTIDDNYYKYFPEAFSYVKLTPYMCIDSNDVIHIISSGRSSVATQYHRVNYSNFDTVTGLWSIPLYRIGGVTGLGATSPASESRIAVDGSDNLYVAYSCVAAGATSAQVKFTKSVDGGATWSAYIECGTISGYGQGVPEIVVDSTGTYVHIIALGADGTYTTNAQVHYWRSDDGGATFDAVATIDAGASTKTYNCLAINEDDVIMVTYIKSGDIYYTVSTDDGVNWSAPATVVAGETNVLFVTLGSPKGQTGFYLGYTKNTTYRMAYKYYSVINSTWGAETVVTNPYSNYSASLIQSFGNKMVNGQAPIMLEIDAVPARYFARIDNLSIANEPPQLEIALAEMLVPTWSIEGGGIEITFPSMVADTATMLKPTVAIAPPVNPNLHLSFPTMIANKAKMIRPYTPFITHYPTTYAVEILEFQREVEAEATTSDVQIVFTNHGLAALDMIVNVDRRLTDTWSNRGSRGVHTVGVTANSIPLDTAIPDQAAGDMIRLYKYIDRTGILRPGTFRLNRKAKGQSTLDFQIVTDASYLLTKGQFVRVTATYQSALSYVFYGYVDTHEEQPLGVEQITMYQVISCQGASGIPARRTVEISETEGTTCGSIVQKMLDRYLVGEGIRSTVIDAGATITDDWESDAISIKEILDTCAEKSSFPWYINDACQMVFDDSETAGTALHRVELNHWQNFRDIKISGKSSEYFNKLFFVGGIDENGNEIVLSRNDETEIIAQQDITGGTGVFGNVQRDTSLIETNYVTAEAASTSSTINSTAHGQTVGDIVWNYSKDEYRAVLTTPTLNQFTVDAFSAVTARGDLAAEAGTTTTNIKITAHGLAKGDYIYNADRDAYRWVDFVVDADNFMVVAVTGQTTADTIWAGGDTIVYFNEINQILAETAKRQSIDPCTITFKTPEQFQPNTKLRVVMPTWGQPDEYFLIEDVEVMDIGKGLAECWCNVTATKRNNANFSVQRKISYKDYWRDF